jgi:hypothetical protein
MGENGLLTEETDTMRSSTSTSNNIITNTTAGDIITTGINRTITTPRSSTRGRVSPPDVQSGVVVCGIPQRLHGDAPLLALDTFATVVGCEAGHA